MKLTLLIFALIAIMAVTVSGQRVPKEVDAIMTKPAENLKKPLIFTPPVAATAAAAAAAQGDEPVVGAIPTNMKKSVVVNNIYGGAVEFKKGRNVNGCPCRLRVEDNNRYDVQFKPQFKNATLPCPCAAAANTTATTPVLPPVIAQLRPRRFNATRFNATVPCAKPLPVPQPIKVTPQYYPTRAERRAKRLAALQAKGINVNATALNATNCLKPKQPIKPQTIAPEFYPTRAERRARRKAKQAAKAAKKA